MYLANVSPGLKLAIENLVKNKIVQAFCDSDDGEVQIEAFKTDFLCVDVQAAVNRARKLQKKKRAKPKMNNAKKK